MLVPSPAARRTSWCLCLTLCLTTACSGNALYAGDSDESDFQSGGAFDSGVGADDTDGAFGPGDLPDFGDPEEEDSFFALRPAQTDVFVFVANPDRDTVTRVNVLTQAVDTTRVGARPTAVEITANYQTAVVLNRADDTVTILDAATLDQTVVDIRQNLNRIKLSPDGAWAALWHDPNAVDEDDPEPIGATSFNEVSFVELATGWHEPVVVGFNPKDIQFTPDGGQAVVVADATMAVLDLTVEGLPLELIAVADPFTAPSAEEVAVAPDGTFAFVRQFGADELTIVDLITKEVFGLPVGNNPTDLDLTPDGLSALVVSRGTAEVTRFNAVDPFEEPEVLSIPGSTPLGSLNLDADGGTGVLYTTASPLGTYATWDLSDDSFALRPLAKPVADLALTPDGNSLLVVHAEENNNDGSTQAFYQDVPALSLISLQDFRANTLALSAEPEGFANANNGQFGYVILKDAPVVEILDYSSLIFDEITLASQAVYVGVLPDLDTSDNDEPPAWISQEHPLGRISFYDPDVGTVQTVTGFELNSQIED